MTKITNTSTLTSKYTLTDGTQKESTVNSNVSETWNMTKAFLKERVSKESAIPGEEVLQTLTLTNQTTQEIFNIVVTDTIGTGATFKTGTVSIDGNLDPSLDITTGITLPNSLAGGKSTVITYTITIDNPANVESLDTVSSVKYSIDEITDLVESSNTTTIKIDNQMIAIDKTSDKSAVISGQTLTFQNVIENKGNMANTDLFFQDPIPTGTQFVTGSVTVNDESKPQFDPATGFALGTLNPGEKITVRFNVKVD